MQGGGTEIFMKEFMGQDFLLNTKTAAELFETANKEPIFDYHCHLSPKEIAENKHFSNLTEVWLYGDHYKWRAMRAMGVDEYYITGDADDYEKFMKFAEVIPRLIGNPLYHWTHLELQRFFGIKEPLSPLTAKAIWDKANAIIKSPGFCVFNILKKFNVKGICTTDDPADSLEYHKEISQNPDCETIVLPTFRPDNALNIEKDGFCDYVARLGSVCTKAILSYADFKDALEERLLFFRSMGGRISDHGLNDVYYNFATEEEAEKIFKKALKGEKLTQDEIEKYKTVLLTDLGKMYYDNGFVMQLHMNVIRNANSKMFGYMGADTGFDSVNDAKIAVPLSKLLDSMEKCAKLPKTILYSLNPTDYYVLGTMLGNFQEGGIKGKIQLGSGWWFCDQKDGMEYQIKTLANLGVLPTFVGMLTDSRSFLSYPRHEYFRRILCNIIGGWVENGEYPNTKLIYKIVSDICYNNIKNYLEI